MWDQAAAKLPVICSLRGFNFMKKYSIYLFAVLFLFNLVSCSSLEKKTLTLKKAGEAGNSGAGTVQEASVVRVKAEIARKAYERDKGFMFRKHIPEGTGMLFVFENDQILRFWMKNTPTPLSIAFITKEGKIRDIFDMTPYSLSNTVSTGYVRYALEVPQGWFSKVGIEKGDYLELDF